MQLICGFDFGFDWAQYPGVIWSFFASSNFRQGFLNTVTGVVSGDQSHTWETRGVRSTEHKHNPMVQLQEGGYPPPEMPPPEMGCSPSPSPLQVKPTVTFP